MSFLLLDTSLSGTYTLYRFKEEFKQCASLFGQTKDSNLEDAAPYLFNLGNENFKKKFSGDLIVNKQFYILLESDEPFEKLSNHFRKFLYKVVDKKEYFFRFYDPRIVSVLLQSEDAELVNRFFGSIKAFVVEAPEPGFVKRYSLRKGKVHAEQLLKTTYFEMEEAEAVDILNQSKYHSTPDEKDGKKNNEKKGWTISE